jgi:DMSO/TMAO reductase YedYZ molybdopterin-dependent catalytic subunit
MDIEQRARQPRPVHIGRGVFLAALGAGLAGLLAGARRLPGFSLLASAFSVNGFQIYTTSGIPQLSAQSYSLTVDGLVGSPASFALTDLLAMPSSTIVKKYQCVTGWVVEDCRWEGIRLSELLARVRPHSIAKYVLFTSADGSYSESLSMEQARAADVLLGYRLNGRSLSAEQGYPIRLVAPEMYGYKYIKWVDHVILSADLRPGYWEQRGYAVDAWLGPIGNMHSPQLPPQPGSEPR